jgi:hypothetical protein
VYWPLYSLYSEEALVGLIRLLGVLLLPGLVLLTPSVEAREGSVQTVIGFSQGGIPLVVHHLGMGATRVLAFGGQHGGPERNTIELADRLRQYFESRPEEIPSNVTLDLLVAANPDGEASGSRQFLSGVDPNRNWGSDQWQADGFDSNGQFRVGLGGAEPFSEPETRALRDWVIASRPVLVINYHSAGGFMFGSGSELVDAYAEASGYFRPTPGGGGQRLLNYRVTGGMNVWLRDQGIPGILVELTSPTSVEFERNLAGLRAVLARLAVS